MKNILKIVLICFVALTLTNCEDNEKSPVVNAPNGTFVLIDITNSLIDVTQIGTSAYGGTLRAPAGNVASHSFEVRAVQGTSSSEFVPIYTTTTFPADFLITAGDVATALGVDVSTFAPGTRFDFVGTSVGTDGSIITSSSLSGDLQAEVGQRQAYDLLTFISCPVDTALIAGSYDVIQIAFSGFFGETNFVRTVVAGPGAGQITIVEGEYTTTGGDPLILDIDFATGIITGGGNDEDGNSAVVWAEGTNGLVENTYLVEGGFFFSCVGTLSINMNFFPFNGNAHVFELQKQ
ncbi:hypothetical protein [Aquimarina sp. 2201CG5-10]|uniref:hypothetical protein n=1 Tax=Aquimarina callyspongiae TaxID=3098150 RepID=UPI002AB484F4|nr:hypothetical protein [Aquimarina sp. 2201CG5-10]MDY8134433.1 hypothetical protein [Aquimarina sp. 2201CG5-10]